MYTKNWQVAKDGDEVNKMQAPSLGYQVGLTNGEVCNMQLGCMNACRTRRMG